MRAMGSLYRPFGGLAPDYDHRCRLTPTMLSVLTTNVVGPDNVVSLDNVVSGDNQYMTRVPAHDTCDIWPIGIATHRDE